MKIFESNIELKPSDFAKISPMNCVFKHHEHEIIAQNIMQILKRTGNEFRPLSWKEYKDERLKDRGFTEAEKPYFNLVVNWCTLPGNAVQFAPTWNIKAEAEIDAEKYNL
jgi:hypothetical protein